MRIITITGEKPHLRNYAPATFFLGRDALYNTPDYPNGREIVILESPAFGLMFREDMTIADVLRHVENMKEQGFTIREQTITYPHGQTVLP